MTEVNKVKARWQKEDRKDFEDVVNALLATANGQKFLWWLLTIGKVGIQPFNGNALSTAFSCGELNIGNQIQAELLSVSSDGYCNLLKEQANARSARDAELSAAHNLDRVAADPADGVDYWE